MVMLVYQRVISHNFPTKPVVLCGQCTRLFFGATSPFYPYGISIFREIAQKQGCSNPLQVLYMVSTEQTKKFHLFT
jgi:hypothetical protein